MSIRTFFADLFGNTRYIQHLEQEVIHLRQENSFLNARIEKLELIFTQPNLSASVRRPNNELPASSIEEQRPAIPATFAGGWTKYLNAHLQQMEAEAKKAS